MIKLFKLSKYEFISVQENQETSTIVISVTSPDMSLIGPKALSDYMTEQQVLNSKGTVLSFSESEQLMGKYLNQMLDSKDIVYSTHEATIKLERINGIWFIKMDGELQNRLSGSAF